MGCGHFDKFPSTMATDATIKGFKRSTQFHPRNPIPASYHFGTHAALICPPQTPPRHPNLCSASTHTIWIRSRGELEDKDMHLPSYRHCTLQRPLHHRGHSTPSPWLLRLYSTSHYQCTGIVQSLGKSSPKPHLTVHVPTSPSSHERGPTSLLPALRDWPLDRTRRAYRIENF